MLEIQHRVDISKGVEDTYMVSESIACEGDAARQALFREIVTKFIRNYLQCTCRALVQVQPNTLDDISNQLIILIF